MTLLRKVYGLAKSLEPNGKLLGAVEMVRNSYYAERTERKPRIQDPVEAEDCFCQSLE